MKTSSSSDAEAASGNEPLVQSENTAPDAHEGFDRARQGAPRASDKEQYRGQSGYGGLAAYSAQTEHEASEHRTSAPGQKGSFGEGNYGGELGQNERGGVSSYGNSSGSRYSIDNEDGTSSRTPGPETMAGHAVGAAPVSTNARPYAGEYADNSKAEAQVPRELPHPGPVAVESAELPTPESTPEDLRLQETIGARLAEHPHLDLHDVSVAVAGKTVRLEGSVPERRMKNTIEDVADNVDGVLGIDNRIKVRRPEATVASFASGYSEGQAYAAATESPNRTGPATYGVASGDAAAKNHSKDQKDK